VTGILSLTGIIILVLVELLVIEGLIPVGKRLR